MDAAPLVQAAAELAVVGLARPPHKAPLALHLAVRPPAFGREQRLGRLGVRRARRSGEHAATVALALRELALVAIAAAPRVDAAPRP